MKIRRQTKLWRKADGTTLRICDMDDSHLKNAIKMLIRNANRHKNHAAMIYNTIITGELALDMIEASIDDSEEPEWLDFSHPILANLVLEAKRRKIDVKILERVATKRFDDLLGYNQVIEQMGKTYDKKN